MDQPPPVQMRSQLLSDGLTDAELLRMRRSGVLADVRRGSYVAPDDPRLRRPEARHRLLIESTLPRLKPGAVLSHVSAAVWLGLPIWRIPMNHVHVTRDGRAGGRVSGRQHLHVAPLDADEVMEVGGVMVTSWSRTTLDVARTASFEAALVVADATLAAALEKDPTALLAAHERAARWRGAPAALRVVKFADGRSESVGETRSRLAMKQAGIPTPVLQWEVSTAGGVHRTDFGWPDLGTVGEFDGLVKYRRLVRPGQDPSEVVIAEKLREDDLRGERLGVVRWIWDEIDPFTAVAARLRRSFGL
jgi:hypothetical protein